MCKRCLLRRKHGSTARFHCSATAPKGAEGLVFAFGDGSSRSRLTVRASAAPTRKEEGTHPYRAATSPFPKHAHCVGGVKAGDVKGDAQLYKGAYFFFRIQNCLALSEQAVTLSFLRMQLIGTPGPSLVYICICAYCTNRRPLTPRDPSTRTERGGGLASFPAKSIHKFYSPSLPLRAEHASSMTLSGLCFYRSHLPRVGEEESKIRNCKESKMYTHIYLYAYTNKGHRVNIRTCRLNVHIPVHPFSSVTGHYGGSSCIYDCLRATAVRGRHYSLSSCYTSATA